MTSHPGGPHGPTRRERFRALTLREIKDAARGQMEHGGGAGALSLKALAAQLGMAGPSLYRYVASRDELLTELLVEAYTELADALEAAVADRELTPAQRLREYARAYRRWGLGRPAMYELVFGTPVPGYAAPEESTRPAARRALVALVVVLAELRDPTADRAALTRWAQTLGPTDQDASTLLLAVQTWSRLHGVLSLELRGHLTHLVGRTEDLYESEIDLALRLAVA